MRRAIDWEIVITLCVILVATEAAVARYNPSQGRWTRRDMNGTTPTLGLDSRQRRESVLAQFAALRGKYSPIVGQYADGANLYAYVKNSPLVAYDPAGLKAKTCEDPKDLDNTRCVVDEVLRITPKKTPQDEKDAESLFATLDFLNTVCSLAALSSPRPNPLPAAYDGACNVAGVTTSDLWRAAMKVLKGREFEIWVLRHQDKCDCWRCGWFWRRKKIGWRYDKELDPYRCTFSRGRHFEQFNDTIFPKHDPCEYIRKQISECVKKACPD